MLLFTYITIYADIAHKRIPFVVIFVVSLWGNERKVRFSCLLTRRGRMIQTDKKGPTGKTVLERTVLLCYIQGDCALRITSCRGFAKLN